MPVSFNMEIVPQLYRITEELRWEGSPKPLLKTGSYSRFFRTISRCVVSCSQERRLPNLSGPSLPCLTTLMVKKVIMFK